MNLQHQNSSSNSRAVTAQSQSLSFDDIADFFSLPLYDAASTLGVCATVLKKICRENGLERWPHRKFLAGKTVEEIKRHAARERRKEITELSKLHRQSNSQPQENEPSKLQGAVAVPNLQQHGTKNIQTEQAPNPGHRSLITGMAMSDEFKYGFPSDGLSITTNKWWGSSKCDGKEIIVVDGTETEGGDTHQSIKTPDDTANEKPDENGKLQDAIGLHGSGLLTTVRKRTVEGREALKLGIYRGYGMKRLGKRQESLLLRIFKSSLPNDWIHGPC